MSHAKFAPSSASRWLSCSMSLVLKPQFESKSNEYAERGTALHDLAHDVLMKEQLKLSYGDYVPTEKDFKEIINPYVEYIESIEGDLRLYEQKAHINSDCYGTADAVIYNSKTNSLHIADLKTGSGVFVNVKNNLQLQIYALGVVKQLVSEGKSIGSVHVHVIQPTLDNIASEKVKVKDLVNLQKRIEQTIELVNQEKGEYKSSTENCRWCPHATYCPEIKKQVDVVAKNQFETFSISEKLDLIPALKSFIQAVEERAMTLLLEGKEIENYHLKPGRKQRKWIDEDKTKSVLEGILKEDLFERKILSVAKTEKLLKKNKIEFDLDGLFKSESSTVKITRRTK